MPWWIYCIIPAFLWGMNNLVDQHILRKHFPNDALGFMAMCGVFSTISGLVIVLYSAQDYPVTLTQALLFLALGVFSNIAHIPYSKALQIDEASIVVPLFQLIPIFVFIIAWLFLGETITTTQFLASALIIIAAMGVLYDFKAIRFKFETLILMLLTGLGVGIFTVLSRYLGQEIHWIPLAGYIMIGGGLFSASIFLTKKNSFSNSIALFKASPKNLVLLFILMELLCRSSMLLFQKALTIAPAATLVQTLVNGIQPFVIFGLTFAFAMLTPSTVAKIKLDRIFAFHLFCVATMTMGLYILLA